MALTKEIKNKIIKDNQINSNDTGSEAVKVALLTEEIRSLTQHLNIYRKDFNSKMGLLKMVSRRRRHLNYLARTSPSEYKQLIERLGLKK